MSEPFVLDDEEQVVGGIAYSANTTDQQGEYINEEDLWAAAKSFARNGNVIRLEHAGRPVACQVLESFVCESACMKSGQQLRKGDWWLSARVDDPGLWKKIKRGDVTGWSLGGSAIQGDSDDE